VPQPIDLAVLAVIALFTVKGFWKGFFIEALTFAGYFASLFVTMGVYKQTAAMANELLGSKSPLTSIVVFIALLLGVSFAFSMAGRLLTKGVDALKLSGVNRAFGGAFGAGKGAFLCGVVLAVLTEKAIFPSLTAAVGKSALAPTLADGANELLKFLRP
jgi:uncharacterized membrane protein required for colicin V production